RFDTAQSNATTAQGRDEASICARLPTRSAIASPRSSSNVARAPVRLRTGESFALLQLVQDVPGLGADLLDALAGELLQPGMVGDDDATAAIADQAGALQALRDQGHGRPAHRQHLRQEI